MRCQLWLAQPSRNHRDSLTWCSACVDFLSWCHFTSRPVAQTVAALFAMHLSALQCALGGKNAPQLLHGSVRAPLGNEQSLLYQQSFGKNVCSGSTVFFFCLHGVFKRHLCLRFTSPGSASAYAIASSRGGADGCLPSFQDHVPRRKLDPGPAEGRG